MIHSISEIKQFVFMLSISFEATMVGISIGLILCFLTWMLFRPEWNRTQKMLIGFLGLGLIVLGVYLCL
ncbi:hypothetical protein E0K83_00680 [Gramella sp. BOM4]|nr:hypothetical protein [Christiangramia bathymodioli]